jgi:hypothetical protein
VYISCTGSTSTSPVPASVNANLQNLTVSNGTLSPVFAANTVSYTLEVANAVTSITVTPTVDAAGVTVTVNGITTTSGSASNAIGLLVGTTNGVVITVKGTDNVTIKEYTIIVTRVDVSHNADLSNLVVSQGNIGTFIPATTDYNDSVIYTASSMTVTPTVAGVGATVAVNGTAVSSGSASGSISLPNVSPATNTITIVITAQDTTTVKTYTITVTRAEISSNEH